MSDIRTGLKTTEEYQQGVSIQYVPAVLALPKKREIVINADQITFKELNILTESVVPSFLTSEMTDINHAKVAESSRTFKAYGKGIALNKSNYRNSGVDVQTFHDQVLRQLAIQFDNLGFSGDGSNNGLITSSDPNLYTPSSAEIPASSGGVTAQANKAAEIGTALNIAVNDYTASSNITVFFYGSALLAFLGKITEGQENNIRSIIRNSFAGKNVTFVDISALALTGISTNGIIVASNDLVTLEHCGAPTMIKDGVNDEKDYYWARYFHGSLNVRPETYGALIKQAITFA